MIISSGNYLCRLSTAEAVVNYIKKQIEDGSLKSVEKLPKELLLRKDLGVSRFTLREALARLNALGITKTTQGKGTTIAEKMSSSTLTDVFIPLFANQSIKSAVDFFEARLIIESEAVMLSAKRRSDEDLRQFEVILAESRRLINDAKCYEELDFLFHRQISQSSGNIFIQNMMDCINGYTRRFLHILAHSAINRTASISAHEEIFNCIKNKNTQKAGVVTRKHLSRMLVMMEKLDRKHKLNDSEDELRNVLDVLRQKEGILK
jgi:GntR family transcriptional regulator, transcriptional repressor for pyruvate dehydrogenase complex